jgi:hypothetical protein
MVKKGGGETGRTFASMDRGRVVAMDRSEIQREN